MEGFIIALIIGLILSYYIITRVLIIFLMGFHGEKQTINRWIDEDHILIVFAPITGELILLFAIYSVIVVNLIKAIASSGENTNKYIINYLDNRKNEKARREKYLNTLSKYGLTGKDIPAFVKDSKSLDEYLAVWEKHGAI